MLPVLSSPLFSPVEVKDGCSPLMSCVLSVSQFTGVERECLVELAKHLGARCGHLWWRLSVVEAEWRRLSVAKANGCTG